MSAQRRTTERGRSLNTLMKRYRDPISVLGVLLVFVTFVVKDSLEEKWKDDAGTIELARDFYDVRAGSAAILNFLVLSRQASPEKDLEKENSSDPEFTYRMYTAWYQEASTFEPSLISSVGKSLDHIELLMKKFSHENADDQMLKAARDKISVLAASNSSRRERLKEIIDLLEQRKVLRARSKDFSTEQLFRFSQLEAEIAGPHILFDIFRPLSDSSNLFQKVIAEAESAQRRNETLASWAWWASIALYGIGAGGAVIGRLYGVPPKEA